MCRQISSQLVSTNFVHHGLSGVRFGRMPSNPVIRECRRMSCSSAKYSSRGAPLPCDPEGVAPLRTHFAKTTSADYGCSCHRRRPWHSVVWCLRFRAARSHHGMFAPLLWRLSLPGRHIRRRMRPTRIQDEPVRVPSPVTADLAIQDLTGALIYDGRPRILPVSIQLPMTFQFVIHFFSHLSGW